MTRYTVFIERAEDGGNWGAWSPDLGVFVVGDSIDEAVELVGEGIRQNVALRRELSQPIPEPSATAREIVVP